MPVTDLISSREYMLFCQARLGDPYPLLQRLRSEDPVHWSEPLGSWVLTRYDDVFTWHTDPRLSSDKARVMINHLPQSLRTKVKPLGEHLRLWTAHMDPPVHTRSRNLVHKAFTPRVIEKMRAHIQEIVDTLIDRVEPRGGMDVVADFAYPLPVTVVCELLGIPPGDRDQFTIWVEDIVAFIDGTEVTRPTVAEQALKNVLELNAYFEAIVARRRLQPRDDLISSLCAVEEGGDRLSGEELLAMCVQMLVGGHDTTTGLISNGMLALLQNPRELYKLKADPSLIGTAVEEFLRFESPGPRNTRLVLEDIEIGGHAIRRGQAVVMMLGAANRDPAQFPDPDRLDICRQPNKHLAFGFDIHYCLGAPLARLEAQVAVSTLLRRLPNLRLASESFGDDPPWRESMGLRMLDTLPVVFSQ